MDKNKIKNIINEFYIEEKSNNPHIKKSKKIKKDVASDDVVANITNLLQNNDVFNHAAIVRGLKGDAWDGKSEATKRSLFRKKLNKEKSDPDATPLEFDQDEASQIQKILMGVSSKIDNTLGREGK